MARKKIDIGMDAKKPKNVCSSESCPWHGHLRVRGRVFQGRVVSDKAPATVIVQWDHLQYVPKYERYERRRTRVAAHNPVCISAKESDIVRIAECRPLSKMKSFVVIEKIA
jgi:small subunit ribosomal protein S17